MKKYDFNEGWTCRDVLGGQAYPVTLPHDAMIGAPRKEQSKGEGNIGWFVGQDVEYRKVFEIPRDYEGKRLLLEFEGAYKDAEVRINGKPAGGCAYGYSNFTIDLVGKVAYGSLNEITVLCKNSDQPNSRWYTGTGLYRPVFLYVGEKVGICKDGVRVRTVRLTPPTIEIEVDTTGDGEVSIEVAGTWDYVPVIRSKAMAREGKAKFLLAIGNARLWSPKNPVLYQVRVHFGKETWREIFGIRQLAWTPEEGLTINGDRYILRGACIHHDNGILGACAFPEAEERKVRILMANGYNAIRSAHNPCSKALLAACDKLGMLVMDEYVDAWYIHKTKYDYATQVEKHYKEDLAAMVAKDYNHPSVIMYSTGNEVSETAQKKGIELTGEMTKYLHSLDATRPVTCGINIFFNFLSSIGLGVYTDDKAEKASEASGKPKKKKPVGSEFYNTLALTFGDFTMKAGATLYPCDLKTRGAFAQMDIAGYNYGIFRYKHDLKKYPKRLILGSETFCKDAYDFWEIAKDNKRIIGDFVWTGIDYIGEVGDGAAEYADYRLEDVATRMTGGNGRIDILGRPRTEALYTKVAFEQEKGPFLSIKPAYEKEKLRLTGWQLTKGLESWSYRGCEGKPTLVEVFARGAEAEIQINGKSFGKRPLKKCRTSFSVPYSDGWITAISFDEKGQEIGRKTLRTAGERTILEIQGEKPRLSPGEIGFFFLRFVDGTGIWKPMEKHTLTVEVENGELLGLGNACPYVKGNYNTNKVETYFGEAMAAIRAPQVGRLSIKVKDETGRNYGKIVTLGI